MIWGRRRKSRRTSSTRTRAAAEGQAPSEARPALTGVGETVPVEAGEDTGGTSRAKVVVTLVNKHGLHMRPARQVEELANSFPCEITLVVKGLDVDAKSLLDIMMLAAERGDEVEVSARGPKAREAAEALGKLLATLPDTYG